MIDAMTNKAMLIALLLAGLGSVLLYLWRRQLVDALLAAVATAALALLAHGWPLAGGTGTTLTLDAARPPASLAGVRDLALTGEGLREGQWRDLPARPLAWTAPTLPTLRLDFPRRLPLGRIFTLAVARDDKTPARLQLLDENGRVLSETRGPGTLTVSWLPLLAETLLLQARLLDDAGKVLAQGPVPVEVAETPPLQVRGRFSAPSFDLRVLNELLVNSRALVDWEVALGKSITRSERARDRIATPDLLVVDAAWFERAPAAGRNALLEQVRAGSALLVLGGSANDAGVWARTLDLRLQAQSADKVFDTALRLPAAPFNPATRRAGAWTGSDAGLWSRGWGKGRIGWLGVADWHRVAIGEPRALALWWQEVLDALPLQRVEEREWLVPNEMPLPGQRLEVCARGVQGKATFPQLAQSLAWQRRVERVDASCVAVWPAQPGWLRVDTGGATPVSGWVYVYAPGDWPLWQAAERRAATARYAARPPEPFTPAQQMAPRWPFAVLFGLAMLALWWRERR